MSLPIPGDIILLQTVRSEGVLLRTDIYIEPDQWFRATGHFFTLTLATGHCEAPGLDPMEQTDKHFTNETQFCRLQ